MWTLAVYFRVRPSAGRTVCHFGYSLATSKCSPPKTGKNESEEESSELGRPTSVIDNPKIEIETNEVETGKSGWEPRRRRQRTLEGLSSQARGVSMPSLGGPHPSPPVILQSKESLSTE